MTLVTTSLSAGTVQDLRDFVRLPDYHAGILAHVTGTYEKDDLNGADYRWEPFSTEEDDNYFYINPTDTTETEVGRWHRVAQHDADTQSDWNATDGPAEILNKPLFATVAFSGVYNHLIGVPTLHAVATSGNYNDLNNKPVLFSGAYADLTGKPTLATVATSGSYNDLTNKPTIPASVHVEKFAGTTNASGVYTVTFAQAFGSVPHISATIIGGTANQELIVTSLTTTGASVKVVQRNPVTIGVIEVLLANTTNVNGASVSIQVS